MLRRNLVSYVYMTRKLAYKEDRSDVCTVPYGINTPGACEICLLLKRDHFIFLFILLILCLFGEFIRKHTPGVALLFSISAFGFTYLALNEYLQVAASPIVSFLPFTIVMLGYFGDGKGFLERHS